MNIEKQTKISQVKEISKKLSSAKSMVVAEYAGLGVKELQDLRKQLKANNVEIKVYKNRLFKIAAKEAKLDIENFLIGPNIYAFGMEDDISPAKILTKFSKNHKFLKLKVGTFEGKVIDELELAKIALLPTLGEAYLILATSMMRPLYNISIGLNMLANDVFKINSKDDISKKIAIKKNVLDAPTPKNTK